MSLSEAERERLADLVELQPTRNAELVERWGMDGGSAVHSYLEDHLKDYYYRDEDSHIRATPEAERLVHGEDAAAGPTVVRASPLQRAVFEALPGPDGEPKSVVATLHAVADAGVDADVDDVRSTLHGLTDRGVVERVQTTVPTFRLALARADLELEAREA